MAVYTAGGKVRLSATFTDNANNPVDPTTLSLKVAGATQTYNPGNIVRDGVGAYHYDLDTTGLAPSGTVTPFGGAAPLSLVTVWYEWIATGTGQGAAVGSIQVQGLPI